MACINLTDTASFEQDNALSSELCKACQQLFSFSFSLIDESGECLHGNFRGIHFHTDYSHHVPGMASCAGCRLVVSAARLADPEITLEPDENRPTAITLDAKPFEFRYLDDTQDPQWGPDGNNRSIIPGGNAIRLDIHSDVLLPGQRPAILISSLLPHDPPRLASSPYCISGPSSSSSRFGRVVPLNIDPGLIKSWMQFCDDNHPDCSTKSRRLLQGSQLRMIDVQGNNVVDASSPGKYVALSYVWGRETVPLLTKDTMARYYTPGALDDPTLIPQTILDAMKVVADIGHRYLWVDSLCIIQDDPEDKNRQLPLMGDIYSHADVVIVAASGSNAHEGIPGVRDNKNRTQQIIETINGIRFTTAHAGLIGTLHRSTWTTRGWTFQEAILARRALVFAEDQVFWTCRLDSWREDTACEFSAVRAVLDGENSFWEQGGGSETCSMKYYCMQVEPFSQKRFKDEADVLWAFMGILKAQRSRFKSGYIWGLPREKLDAALLWKPVFQCIHRSQSRHAMSREGRSYSLPFPSWSWVASHQPVTFLDPCGDSIMSEVTWHDPLPYWHDKLAGTGLQLDFAFPPGTDATDYALLYFTAQTAMLDVTIPAKASDADDTVDGKKDSYVPAVVQSPSGKSLAKILVPQSFFPAGSFKRTGEFVLLSSNIRTEFDDAGSRAKDTTDSDDCDSAVQPGGIVSHNVMLVEWKGCIAERLALGKMSKSGWRQVSTRRKTIILS